MRQLGFFETAGALGLADPTPSDRLATFGRHAGLIDDGDHAVNEVLLDGTITDVAARLWPSAMAAGFLA